MSARRTAHGSGRQPTCSSRRTHGSSRAPRLATRSSSPTSAPWVWPKSFPWAQPDRVSVTTNDLDARADPAVLDAHARDVLAIAKTAVLFVLDVPVAIGVRRRHVQRGIAWLEGYARHAPPLRPDESIVDRCIRVFERGAGRRGDIVRAHMSAGWAVAHLDGTAPEEIVRERALRVLR